MYKCSQCKEIVGPKTKCCKVIVQTRSKEYFFRSKVYPGYFHRGGKLVKSSKWKDRRDDPGGVGQEILKEINLCPKCAAEFSKDTL